MDFKTTIQGWLRAKGMLQGDLALMLEITPQTLSTMLARGNPTLSTLHRFARTMNVSIALFEDDTAQTTEDHEAKIMSNLAATSAYLDNEEAGNAVPRPMGSRRGNCTREDPCCEEPQVILRKSLFACSCLCHE